MTHDSNREDPAFSAMTMDILSYVLSSADNSIGMSEYLVEAIRELTGARCVLLVQYLKTGDQTVHQVLSVNPVRRQEWAQSQAANRLYDLVSDSSATRIVREADVSEESCILKQEGFSLSLVIPLNIGAIRTGAILVLGLPDEVHLASELNLLSTLSTVVALVLRNAFLYEKQEQIINVRTLDLQKSYAALCESEQQVKRLFESAQESRRALLSILEDQKLVEDALRKSEAKYRELIQKIQAAVIVHGPDTRILTCNVQAQQLLGLSEEQLMGKAAMDPDWHFFREEGSPMPLEEYPVNRVLLTKQPIRNYITGVHRPNMEDDVWVLVGADPVLNELGEIIQVIVTFVDITERKRAEVALRSSEERYRSLFDNMMEGCIYCQVVYDDQGYPVDAIYLDHNEAYLKTSGLKDIIGKKISDVFPGIKETHSDMFEHYARVVLTGKPERFEWFFRPLSLWLNVSIMSPIKGYFIATYEDITERKWAEEIRNSNLRLLESMDLINKALQGTTDLNQMMSDVLTTVLSVFDCDRAFLQYPCDPEASSWTVPMECNRPEYPGVRELGLDIPMDSDVALTFKMLLESKTPVKFGPETNHPLPEDVAKRFGFKSFMSTAIYPKIGKPWQFGVHQCSYARVWTPEEERLFQDIGLRLGDALSSLLALRNVQESEERFHALFENSPISIWEEDCSAVKAIFTQLREKGVDDFESYLHQNPEVVQQCAAAVRVTDVNQATLSMHEADNKDQLFRGLDRVFTPESLATFRRELIALWNGKTVMTDEGVILTLTGKPRQVIIDLSVCPGYEQTLSRVLLSLTDITERKQAEEALRRSQRKLSLHLEQTIFAVIEWDTDFKARYWNPAAERIFGYASDEAIGRSGPELIIPNIIQADIDNGWNQLLNQSGGTYKVNENITKDGKTIICEWINTPLVDETGTVTGVMSIANDITEREQAEKAILESEQKYRQIFNNVLDGLYLLEVTDDGRFRTVDVNPALEQITGIPRSFSVGKTQEETVPEDVARIVNEKYQRCVETEQVTEEEVVLDLPAGQRIFHSMLIPTRDESGQIYRIIGISRDITERKQAELEIFRTNRALRMLSDSNQALIRMTDEAALLNEVCRIAVEIGGYRMAWVAFVEQDAAKTLRPVAHAGVDSGYIESAKLSWADNERGRGPGGIAVRTKQHYIARDIHTNPSFAPWREAAIQRGYQSIIALPLLVDDDVFGVLGIYAAEADAFDAKEIDVLKELSGDVAFGIKSIHMRVKRDHAEAELRKLSRAIEQSPASIIITDTKGDIEYVNPRFTDVTGYTAPEVLGKNPRILKSDELPPEVYKQLWESIVSGKEWHGEFHNRKKNGELYWESASISPIFDINGTITHFLAVKEDITNRKSVDEELRKWAHVFEHAEWGVVVGSSNGQTLELMNPAFAKMHGFSVEELRGKPIVDVFAPESRTDLPEQIQTAHRTGHHVFEARHLRKDGSIFPVLIDVTAVKNDSGDVLYRVVNVQDITARKYDEVTREVLFHVLEASSQTEKLEDLLALVQTHLGELVDTTNFVVALYHQDVNAYSFPYYADEFDQMGAGTRSLRKSLTDYVRRTAEPLLADQTCIQELENAGEIEHLDPPLNSWLGVPMKTSHGTIGVMTVKSYSSSKLFTEADLNLMTMVSGQVAMAVERKLNQDAIKASEERLLVAQRMEAIGRLAGGVSHDFNNLLTAISGHAEIVLREISEHDPLRQDLEEILKTVFSAGNLTRQLLTFSRKQIVAPVVLDLDVTIANMLRMLKRMIGENIEIQTSYHSEPWRIKADPSQAEQVIVNLVVNARDAMPNGGCLSIETVQVTVNENYPYMHPEMTPGDYVMLAVSDTGTGMSAEVQSRIFEPFFTTKAPGKGTGLGLATVYGIVKQSGGYIFVSSEEGKGTTFSVYLQAVIEHLDVAETKAVKEPRLQGTESVLLVEDSDDLRTMFARVFKYYGYRLTTASSGEEALAICNSSPYPFDIVITDVVLPKMNGRELTINLRQLWPSVKVLLMSGYTGDAIPAGVLDLGLKLLQKPFGPVSLISKVREELGSK